LSALSSKRNVEHRAEIEIEYPKTRNKRPVMSRDAELDSDSLCRAGCCAFGGSVPINRSRETRPPFLIDGNNRFRPGSRSRRSSISFRNCGAVSMFAPEEDKSARLQRGEINPPPGSVEFPSFRATPQRTSLAERISAHSFEQPLILALGRARSTLQVDQANYRCS